MGHTNACLDVRLQQRLSEFPVLIPRGLQETFVEVRVVQPKVFQPPQNVIQVSDRICPVLTHPHSTEILRNRSAHLAETIEPERIPLRPSRVSEFRRP